ncbi:uncharacterized protein BKA78DRAFT_171957 [Phyllosticta capitalensis]|uniref:uncharacterized protein n=1 Tax=Phyllosticta capitalensis TaxID=121624 RepID=UPI003130F11A
METSAKTPDPKDAKALPQPSLPSHFSSHDGTPVKQFSMPPRFAPDRPLGINLPDRQRGPLVFIPTNQHHQPPPFLSCPVSNIVDKVDVSAQALRQAPLKCLFSCLTSLRVQKLHRLR